VVRSAPDGYTVFITSNTTHASNQSMLRRVPYDALADFEPVTKLGTITLALVGHPSVPADDIPGLLAYARVNPGKLTFGSGSTSSRAAGELMKTMAGIDMLHVPYRANPMVVTDLLGGQISLFFGDISTSLPPVRAGRLKGFAVSSLQRTPLAPDLPSLDEAGLKGYDLTAWFAAFVPARTPKPVVDKLRETLVRAVEDKATQEKLLQAGIEPDTSTSEGLKAFVQSEIRKWAAIVRAAGIEPE
jgi:tripartite-type tricarboxylate transporter receptor subunit TctC